MVSKIYIRDDGSFTQNEFEGKIQNKSIIPLKYSPDDSNFSQRLELLRQKLSN